MTDLFVEDILAAGDKPFRERAREAYERYRVEQTNEQVQELRTESYDFLVDALGLTKMELDQVLYTPEVMNTNVTLYVELPGHLRLRAYHIMESKPDVETQTITKFDMEEIPGVWLPVSSLVDVGRHIRPTS